MVLLFNKIRNNDDDYRALLRLKSEAHDIYWSGYQTPPDPVKFQHWFIQQFHRTDRIIFLAYPISTQEKSALAYLYITKIFDEHKLSMIELSHGVCQFYTGQGIGTQLINFAVNYLYTTLDNVSLITAWIREEHIASIKTFENNGFIKTGLIQSKIYPGLETPVQLCQYQFQW